MKRILTNIRSQTTDALAIAAGRIGCDLRSIAELGGMEEALRFKPDGALLFLYGDPVGAERALLRLQAESVPVAVWNVDDPDYFHRPDIRDTLLRVARASDVYLSHTRQLEAEYARLGIRVRYVPTGAREFPWSATLVAPPLGENEYERDWAFVGALSPEREKFLEDLRGRISPALRCEVFSGIPLERAYHVFRHSRVNIIAGHMSERAGVRTWAVTERSWEVPLVGGFLLQDARAHLDEHFLSGIETATFRDVADCAAQVERFVGDPVARRALALAAQRRVLADHRIEHRLAVILRLLDAAQREPRPAAVPESTERASPSGGRHVDGLDWKLVNGIPGWLSEEEGNVLFRLARDGTGEGRIVEVGSYQGLSTACLASGLRAQGGRVTPVLAIDPHEGSAEHQPGREHFRADTFDHVSGKIDTLSLFRRNIERAGLAAYVEAWRGTSVAAASAFRGRARLVFIDGDHAYEAVRSDVDAWEKHLAPDGLLALHDYGGWPGPTRAADELMRSGAFRAVERQGSLLVLARCQREARSSPTTPRADRPRAVVFCERLDNESFCESIIRELAHSYTVVPYGPGWPRTSLPVEALEGTRFFLYLDSASGTFSAPEGLEHINIPKFAWIVDAHKKPVFHQSIARRMDLTFFAMKTWGHIFERPAAWLPLHCDSEIFRPVECEREYDIVFVGSQTWRAESIVRIAREHGLRVLVTSSPGAREKSETAAIYAKAKIVFNRHVTNDLNFRVFEAMACGRVLLTDAQWNGQYELFEDGRHYVLYKDEADLEAQILRLLADDALRGRIEREAAAVIAERHSTHSRVGQLMRAIEATVAGRSIPTKGAEAMAAEPVQTSPARRWLFFAGQASPTVQERSYAEELAWGLAARGHDVVIARECRCRLPLPRARKGEPKVLELSVGPLPMPPAPVNALLARSGPLHVRFDAIAREHGPFDVIVGEDALGAMVARPVAQRLRVPFLLCLEESLVGKRDNKLVREDLYLAELEHWGCDGAAAVLVAHADAVAGVEQHYKAATVRVTTPPTPALARPRHGESFLRRLGLTPGGYVVVFSMGASDEALRDAAASTANAEDAVVPAADAVWLRRSSGEVVRLSARPAVGPALAALLADARHVDGIGRREPRARDGAALHGRGSLRSEGGLADLERLAASLRSAPARKEVACLIAPSCSTTSTTLEISTSWRTQMSKASPESRGAGTSWCSI